jgi:hypothetical protein
MADKYATYPSPWQRHWQQPDVVATDKNIHSQYSDIGRHCNNNNIICEAKAQAVRLYDPPCEGPTLINEYNLEEPAVFITFRRLFFAPSRALAAKGTGTWHGLLLMPRTRPLGSVLLW